MQEQRKGELFVAISGILWALFPVVAVLTYAFLPSLHTLAWGTVIATLTFGLIIVVRGKLHELRNILVWKYSALVALLIGVLFYGLYYVGLESTTPGNASIIGLFEIFTAFVFFRLFAAEKAPVDHILGSFLMVFGALIILGKGFTDLHFGDLIVFIATFFTPAGNYYQQKARSLASSETVMFLRSILSVPFLFLLAYTLQPDVSLEFFMSALPYLLVTGIFLLGISKIFWVEAVHRISVSKALALQSIVPFLTLIIAWGVLHQEPTPLQMLSLIPFVIGTLLLTDHLSLVGRRWGGATRGLHS